MRLTIDLEKLKSRGIVTEHAQFKDNVFELVLDYELHQPLFTAAAVKDIAAQVGDHMSEIILDIAADTVNKKVILEVISQL
jgi:hypothetical protein